MKCSKCKRDLQESDFYKRSDGRKRSWCKSCILALSKTPNKKKSSRKYAKTDKGRKALEKYRSTEKYKKSSRIWNRKYIQRDDVKRKRCARERIRYRVMTGKLPHPTELICEYCNSNQAEHYHHYNGYDCNDVKPICSICHMSIHEQYQRID